MISKVCVMGWPIAHSRSPLIHNFWIRQLGIRDAVYERLAVPPEELGETLRNLRDWGFIGANVTVPHKEAVYASLLRHDAIASRLKAVNTIVITPAGLEGRNTDGYGFMANLASGAPGWQAGYGPAVMIGAGGAARAIAAALESAGVPELRIVNRTPSRSAALIEELGLRRARAVAWNEIGRALEGANLVVNTTTLGMKGENDLDLDLSPLPRHALVTDIVYTPLETGLLKAARQRGLATMDGLGMLLHQAVPGFEAWFGVRPKVTPELRALVLSDMGIVEDKA
jgi:shikimate dehydrogenase